MRTHSSLERSSGLTGPSESGSDGDLPVLDALERGDKRSAVEGLMDRYGDSLHRFCVDMVREVALAEDIVQTIFVQVFEDLGRYQRRSSLKTWLFGIARHRCYDELRRARRWRRLLVWPGDLADCPETSTDVEPQVETDQWRAVFSGCLGGLDVRSRECVVLRFAHGMSYDEISETTGDTAGALRVRVNRAMLRLRTCLRQKGVTP